MVKLAGNAPAWLTALRSAQPVPGRRRWGAVFRPARCSDSIARVSGRWCGASGPLSGAGIFGPGVTPQAGCQSLSAGENP